MLKIDRTNTNLKPLFRIYFVRGHCPPYWLSRRFGEIPNRISTKIQQLTVPQLEDLGEALLDFSSLSDLESWLSR